MAVTDDFNRADNADLGANWTPITSDGAFKIVSNQVTPTSLSADSAERYSGTTFSNDQYSQAKLVAFSGAGADEGIGLLVRGSDSARTYYRVTLHNVSGTNTYIGKVVAGAYTQLTTANITWAANDIIRFEAEGTALRVKQNGSTVLSTTDGSISSGWAGLAFSSDLDSATLDDWEGGDLAAAGRTTKNTRSAPLGIDIGMNWRS